MNRITKNISIACLLLALFVQTNVKAQALVGPAPFCMPMYGAWAIPCNQGGPSNTPGNWINDFINSFNTAGAVVNITNNNSGCNTQNFPATGQRNYFFHGCQHYLVVNPGQVITVNIQNGTGWAQGNSVFIDWNNNGVFNLPGERVCSTVGSLAGPAFHPAMNFVVPAAQPPGAYRMRVRCAWATPGNNIDPCNMHGYGETEDYMIYVSQTPPGVITATATSNSPLCNGSQLNLGISTSASPTTVLSYTWSGPGAYSAIIATTTTGGSTNIAVAQPTNSGVYSVTVSTGSCPVVSQVTVNIYPTPTITALANNGPVCQGSSLTINAAANVSATSTYSWTGPNAFASNTASNTINNVQPAATGFYSLTVTNAYLAPTYQQTLTCSATAQMSAAVVPVAPLVVTPFFTLCQNSNLALTAAAVGATSYSWSSSTTPQFTSTLQNPQINNVAPIQSGDYSVTAYYVSPSTTLVCTSTAVTNVSVVPRNPVTPFSSANVCQYTSGTFSATAVGAAGYQWFGPNGFNSTNQINTITNIQPVSAGNYSVNAIFSIGTVSCTTSSFIPLNVIAVPSVAVIQSITVCERQGATFAASAPNALTYMWSGPNSFTMNSPNPIFANLTPNMSGMYTVTASFSNGNLTCYNSNQTNLLVKPILPFNLGSDKLLCSNSDLFLNGPAGATQYNWWGSTSYTSNTQALFVPALSPANSGIYVLEVDLNGCKTYDSVKVDVLTPIIYTLTPSNRTICRGENVNFVVGAAQGSENYAYTWNPAIYITGPTGSVQAGNPLGTTVYNISAYDIACPNYVIQTSFTLTVNQPPQPNVIISKNNVCEPLCMILNSHTQGKSTSVIYDFGNGNVVEGDSVNVCLNAGTYNMKVITTGTNGCQGTFDYTSTPITVFPKPGGDFSWTPETPNTSNNQVTFIPTTKNGKTITYDWQFTNSTNVGGVDTSTSKSPVKIYDNNGKFPVMMLVKNEFGCADTVFKVIEIEEDVNVYIPNTFTPNDDNINDVFNIKGIGLKSEGYYMEVFDRWGTLLYASKDINKGWDGTVKGVKAAEGVYIYRVKVIGNNGVGKKEFKGHVTLLK
jgi:gliding motility-associated-like protein